MGGAWGGDGGGGGGAVEEEWSGRKGKRRRCGKLRASGGERNEACIEVFAYLFRQTGRRFYTVRYLFSKQKMVIKGKGEKGRKEVVQIK